MVVVLEKAFKSLLFLAALCIVVTVGGNASIAHAQTPSALQTMTVSLLPQYDDPRLLIIFEAELDQPGQGAIAIPDAVELHSAEAQQEDGSYQPIEAKFEGATDGRVITFTSPTRAVRLSFYQDVITRDTNHTLDFIMPAQRDTLTSLKWRAVFPLGASTLATDPVMTAIGDVHYGMAGFERDAGALAARTPATQQMNWQRASNSPSFAREVNVSAANENTAIEASPTRTAPSISANVSADTLAEATGRMVRGEAVVPEAEEANWFTPFRDNPIVWGALAVFVVGLPLVLDGIRKRITRKPL